jgi:hypothetical protein
MADLKRMLEVAKESVLRTVAETAERNPGMTFPSWANSMASRCIGYVNM